MFLEKDLVKTSSINMCSVNAESNHSPVKTTTANISYKVKRRLFQDEEDKKYLLFSKSTDANINEGYGNHAVSLSKGDDEVSSSRLSVNQILIITTFEESASMQLLSDQAMCTINNVNVLHCLPENAYRQCDQSRYNIIFTDIDLGKNSEVLRLIFDIRKSSSLNNTTSIIAVRQSMELHKNVESLTYYGVSNVFCGEVNLGQIKAIFQQYKHVFTESDIHNSMIANNPTLESANKLNANPLPPPVCDSTSENTVVVLSKEGEPEVDTTLSSKNESAHALDDLTEINVKEEESKSTSISSCNDTKPVSVTHTNSIANSENACSRPLSRSVPRFKGLHGKFNINSVAPYPLHMRRYPFPTPPLPLPNWNEDVPYMVSGVPGTSEMKLTMIPEDASKHSTKERLRRERIKDCTEKLRNLLPRPVGCTRKLDMATVLELTVMYLKLLQNHSSPVTQEQCSMVFQNSFQQLMGKRHVPEDDKDNIVRSKATMIKKELIDKYSPKRGMMYQPPSSMCPHYRTFGNSTMTAIVPHDGILQSTYQPQLAAPTNPMALTHTRPLLPYQGVEYFNMLFPNAYDGMTHPNQLVQQQRGGGPAIKDPMFSDPQIPLSTECTQTQQHLSFHH